MMLNTPEFKVGALVVIVSGLIGFMSLKVNEGPGLFARTKHYYFDLDDASGLIENSAVKSAGIKVGAIEKIKLINDKARIFVLVSGDVKMRQSGYVELRSDGILGDRHVEIVPGVPTDPELTDGAQILTANERGSMNALMKEIGKISESIGKLAETLNKATGPDGDTSTTLGRIVKNVEKLTADLAQITGDNKEQIHDIVENVHGITEELNSVMKDKGPEGFHNSWHKLATSLDRIEKASANVEAITDKVNKGEGTIGRLINDEETVDKINATVDKVNDFLGGASALETAFDYHSEYLAGPHMMKSYINIILKPGLDRYYELGVVDDPRGYLTTVDWSDQGTYNQAYTEKKIDHNRLKFNAIFAKNFYDFTLRAGIFESSGGAGLDYYMYNHNLRLSFEAFNFSSTTLRAYLRYNIFKGLYLTGGGDSLSDNNLRSAFVGAGIFLTNDDLKMFASKMSL